MDSSVTTISLHTNIHQDKKKDWKFRDIKKGAKVYSPSVCCSLCFQPHLVFCLRDMKGRQGFPSYMSFVFFFGPSVERAVVCLRWGRRWTLGTWRCNNCTLLQKGKLTDSERFLPRHIMVRIGPITRCRLANKKIYVLNLWYMFLFNFSVLLLTGRHTESVKVDHLDLLQVWLSVMSFFPRFLVLIFKVNVCE